MAETTTVEGVALAFTERAFDSFTSRSGGTVAGGITRTLWVGKAFRDEPLEVKVPEVLAGEVARLTRGDSITLRCELFARGDRLSYRLSSIEAGRGSRLAAVDEAAGA